MSERKKLTIKDIALKANTSKTTVSFYLNEKFDKMSYDTRKRIEKVIEETNYTPNIMAQSLKSKKSRLIGVIVADITNPFSNNIVKGIDDIARKEDYQIIFGNSNFEYINEKKYIERMLDMGVDGFIVQPTMQFDKLVADIEKAGKKIVCVDRVSPKFKGKYVKTNNYDITFKAITQLYNRGYEGFIFISEDLDTSITRIERKNGFIDAIQSIGANSNIIKVESQTSYIELSKELMKYINISKKVAIFAAHDKILQKVFRASKYIGWDIPNKVGIIGFDNWNWTIYASPSVTTIDQPTYQEGKHATKLLIDMIENRDSVLDSAVFDCNIAWKESTNL